MKKTFKRNTWATIALAFLVAAALVLAGCTNPTGSDGDDDSGDADGGNGDAVAEGNDNTTGGGDDGTDTGDDVSENVGNNLEVDLYPSVPTHMPLYVDVANEVEFEATNMGDDYDIEIENVQGGVVESAEAERTFIVSPSTDSMTFDVVASNSERSERFEDISYNGRGAPKPRIQLFNTRRSREVERGIDLSDLTSLELNALADAEFQAAYSDDAAVRISDVTVTLDRTSGSPLVRSFTSGDLDLYDFRTPAAVGDNLYIEIHEVERLNYRDEVVEQAEYYPRSFYVPLK